MKEHVVTQGEHLARVTHRAGFEVSRTVWEAGENSTLRKLRDNPNVLLPGDVLVIPPREARHEACATEKRHRFVRKSEKLLLRVALHGLKDKPLAGHACTVSVDTQSTPNELLTDTKGFFEVRLRPNSELGSLIDHGAPGTGSPGSTGIRFEREIEFRIGHLDPVTEVSGQIARLNNLGYDAGELPDHDLTPKEKSDLQSSIQFRSAAEEFQCDHGLAVDGKCGSNTQKSLRDAHGS